MLRYQKKREDVAAAKMVTEDVGEDRVGPELDFEGEEFLQRASCRIWLYSCEVSACPGACYIKQSWKHSSRRFHIEVLRHRGKQSFR